MKINLKSQRAITLIMLSVTIVLLIILSSTAIYTGTNVLEKSRFVKFSTELQIMQTNVNSWYSNTNNSNNSIPFIESSSNELIEQAKIALNNCNIIESNESDFELERFKYYSSDLIKDLGVEGISQDFIVDIKNKTAISLYGIEYSGKNYNMLSQLPNSKYTVN